MSTLTPRQRPSFRNLAYHAATSTPTMPRKVGGNDEIEVGDTVEVPGGMDGTVKFVGEVKGKQGCFVGVELSKRWASRGKNDGEAEGIRYFSTSIPGAGIFLPINRATKRSSPTTSQGSIPATPTTDSFDRFMINEQDEGTPPTPSVVPKFSQSVRARPASPAFKPKSRPSLPRPESPLRRAQAALGPTPGNRPSLNMLSHNRLPGPRYAASPTPAKTATKTPAKSSNFSQSTRTREAPKEDEDEIAHLRAVIQEKNEKIAALTADFDSHRADFRSTLDTLDMASMETERVYEKKVEDLMQERSMLMAQAEDVASVAHQLRQLEEVVQELEEGLEDARRDEAEARGEVEFLRGEVERVRAELRREREKNQAAMANGAADYAPPAPANQKPAEQAAESPAPTAAPTSGGDPDKWCALCEQDGHDSISCPFDKS